MYQASSYTRLSWVVPWLAPFVFPWVASPLPCGAVQIAELIAASLANPKLSQNRVIEAVAETTAPLRPIEELLDGLAKGLTGEEEGAEEEKASVDEIYVDEEEVPAKRKVSKAVAGSLPLIGTLTRLVSVSDKDAPD